MFAIRSAAIAAILSILTVVAQADEAAHKLAIHVDENDPAVMNLALNNAQNVKDHYEARARRWRSRSSPTGRASTCMWRKAR